MENICGQFMGEMQNWWWICSHDHSCTNTSITSRFQVWKQNVVFIKHTVPGFQHRFVLTHWCLLILCKAS